MSKIVIVMVLAFVMVQCSSKKQAKDQQNETQKAFSVLLAESVMNNNPEAWTTDFQSKPRWGYVQGLVCDGILEVWKETGDQKYFDYVKNTYVDLLIDSTGTIDGYKKESFNIDNINSGKNLFSIYEETGDERYRKAIETLRDQLNDHPRVPEGGFWHKKVYTNQMWLDGLYMGAPFYAEYVATFGDSANFSDVTKQLLLVEEHLKDEKTGLYFHGWDSSKSVYWADPETGLSKNFWGRGVGWFYMAIIDVLDFLPKDHPDHAKLVDMFQELTDALINFQDKDSGAWYQVTNFPDREGNYLEATSSCMFAYGMVKGIAMGLLDTKYVDTAMKAYNGVINTFIITDENQNLEITSCCAGAGLGPADNPVRDGTYEYYIEEAKRSNDGKAIGPFIMAALLVENNPDLFGDK